MKRAWRWFQGLKASRQALVVTGIFLVVIVIASIASNGGGGHKASAHPSTTTANQTPPPPPSTTGQKQTSGPKKAANGDDAKDLRNRAQQAVNRTEVCLAALYLASKQTSSAANMASSLQDARSACNGTRDYLLSDNHHGFSDQNDELWAAADASKSATNAGLAYLDTQAPSKLADFRRHVRDANGAYQQGLSDLNARLSELGVAHVKG
jgi:hypothetical protein